MPRQALRPPVLAALAALFVAPGAGVPEAAAQAPAAYDLPIPYRAIATELATGRMVVLERVDLVDAVRASMSAPGVFSPYRVGDRPLLREDELTTPMRAAVQVATILTQRAPRHSGRRSSRGTS
jgi:hypothetical protein